jgi:hypothetical protein
LGLTSTQSVVVSSDSFRFTAPVASTEVPLNTAQAVTVTWTQNNAAVNGQTVNFATTRGTLIPTTAVTNTSGQATVTVSSTNAGPAVISATAAATGGPSAQIQIEFVATTPSSIDVQASPFTIAPQEQSTITAIVRDALGNLVKGKAVDFTLQDVTGGSLSVASAITNSQGVAQTVYTASSQTSASNGVKVTGTVQGTTIAKTTSFTVAGRQVFISIGTGNEILEPDPATYSIPYVVIVTDANGKGVKNVALTLSVLSTQYMKGFRVLPATGPWGTAITAICADEDVNRNGQLDLVGGVPGSGEDFNSSGKLEAGNIASVSPGAVTTGDDGSAKFNVIYPQQYAYYLRVLLTASTSVQGTETSRSDTFVLPGLAGDFSNRSAPPPGPISSFGQSSTCADTL